MLLFPFSMGWTTRKVRKSDQGSDDERGAWVSGPMDLPGCELAWLRAGCFR